MSDSSNNRLTYRPVEAMAHLCIGRTKLYALIKAGRLDARKLGGNTLITAKSLEALVESLPALNS